MVQPGQIRNQPFALPQLRVMSHQLPANRHARVDKIKLGDLLQRTVATVKEHKIDLEARWTLGDPAWNNFLRKTKQRTESVHRVRRVAFEISQHAFVNALVRLDAPEMALPDLFQRAKNVQCAAAAEPGADFQNDLRLGWSRKDGVNQ